MKHSELVATCTPISCKISSIKLALIFNCEQFFRYNLHFFYVSNSDWTTAGGGAGDGQGAERGRDRAGLLRHQSRADNAQLDSTQYTMKIILRDLFYGKLMFNWQSFRVTVPPYLCEMFMLKEVSLHSTMYIKPIRLLKTRVLTQEACSAFRRNFLFLIV